MRNFYTDVNMNGAEIKDFAIDKLSADPSGAGLYTGRVWYNTTTNLAKYYDGTSIQIFANQAYVIQQINQLGQNQGPFDASPGLLPTSTDKTVGDLTTIKRGDFWVISVGGTIAGIGGADELVVGDILQFVGTTPATAADWLGIQRNLDDTKIGDTRTERQTVDLVANTPLNVNAATITDIFSVETYDSVGSKIELDISKLGGANQVTLESKKSLTGVKVDLVGKI